MVSLDFVVLVGTILFFAALHQWPPDGRRWEREKVEPAAAPEAETVSEQSLQ